MTNKLFIIDLGKENVMCIQRNKIAVGFGVKEVLTSGSGLLLTNCLAVKNSLNLPSPFSPILNVKI